MSYQDIACLVLKTNVLPMDGTTNAYGTSNSMNNIFTWTNINLRTLLGDMFDKYDRFLLLLQNISNASPAATPGASVDDRAFVINMNGLSFINSNYVQKFQSNTGSVIICPYIVSGTNAQTQLYNNFAVATFIKQNDIVNISINYTRIEDDVALSTTNVYGTSNSINSIFTWTNINLRTPLGDMFNKYDRFLLLL